MLFSAAFLLRWHDVAYPDFRFMDEARHVPAAANYVQNGQFETDNWEHPPLRHILLHGFMTAFGDNPYGWRMRDVLFGSLAAVLTFLIGREISGSSKAGLLAGLLLATDPLHIMLSRFTYDEIYGTSFILASMYFFLLRGTGINRLVISSLFMGCALAVKWYAVPCWLLFWFLHIKDNYSRRDYRGIFLNSIVWALLPSGVFVLSYYPWFGRGYDLKEFWEFIANAYYSLQAARPEKYDPGLFYLKHVSAGEWFVRPVMVGQGVTFGDGSGEFALFINNLPVWILTFPALAILGVKAIREQSEKLQLPVLMFCATYLLYLSVDRPVFLYSASSLLPFAFMVIAVCVVQLVNRLGARLYWWMLLLVLCWNMYIYPLVTAKKVPLAPYRYILDQAVIRNYNSN